MLRKLGTGVAALCMAAAFSMVACGDDDSGSECGDGVVEGSEVCDSTALGGATCADEGFTGGDLSCNASCNGFDTSACTDDVCGDGSVTGSEDCDGADLDNTACEDLGYDGGDLSCDDTTCTFDDSGCYMNCGDDVVQVGDEVCDGSDLDGADCLSEGFDAGSLACNANCQAYDTAACCDDGCPAADDTLCTADTLSTCALGANGCLDWVDTDCTATGDICSGTPADCNPPCTSDCPAIGDTECADATTLNTCADGGDGCMYWTPTPCGAGGYCWGTPATCNAGFPGEDCSEPAELTSGVNTIAPGTYDATNLDVLDATMVDCYGWTGDTDSVWMFTLGAADNAVEINVTKGVDNRLVAVILDDCLAPTDGTALACGSDYDNPVMNLSAIDLTPGASYYLVIGNAYPSAFFPDPDFTQIEVTTFSHSCGDSAILFAEECDDGNTTDGDGCSSSCLIEATYWCGGEPSVCMVPACGDGYLNDSAEMCDDGNTTAGDGCSATCQVETGYLCTGEPSVCAQPAVYSQTGLALAIPDATYDGTTMTCVSFAVPSTGADTVANAEVEIALDHTWIGDLVIKVISPANTVTTLLSRPGLVETADDGSGCCGDSSNLLSGSPITFHDGSANDAELMGDVATNVCLDDGICDFSPNPGMGPGTNGFADFATESAVGTWQVCIGDSFTGDTGTVDSVTLSLVTN